MSKITVALKEVTVRRDANTIITVTVPPHELSMMRANFGKENVTEGDEVGTVELDAAGEYERLSAKYGAQKIVKVFGDDGGERLAELAEKHAVKKAAAGKKKAGTEAAEGNGQSGATGDQ